MRLTWPQTPSVQLASVPILNGIICATPGFLWTLASPASSGAFEVPGREQPHLAEHSQGQW
jgi:hypothetical protein